MKPSSPFAVIVNDDATQLKLLSGLVRKAGLEPRVFTRAEAALIALSSSADNPPALIVTDLYMPGIDGWQFCRLLRSPDYKAFNKVPILVISATFSGEQSSRIAADLGAEAFLSSPVDGERFCEQVQAILSGKQLRHPLRVLIVDDSAEFCRIIKNTSRTTDTKPKPHSQSRRLPKPLQEPPMMWLCWTTTCPTALATLCLWSFARCGQTAFV